MKKITYCFLVLSALASSSCEFNKSVNIDLSSGLSSKGSGLSCDDVCITVNDEKVSRNEFVFGEVFQINFNNIEGFKRVDGGFFPGMKLLILAKQGDTILYNPDMYSNLSKPTLVNQLILNTAITIGAPFRSNHSYTATVHIWDKKGKGTFDTKFEFSTVSNKHIKISNNGVTANEVYLYDKKTDTVIPSNKIPFKNEIILVFDNLKGLQSRNTHYEPGMRMRITDKNGKVILNEDDLLKGQTMEANTPNQQVLGSFFLPKNVKGPINLNVVLWDKIGTGKITAKAKLELE